MIGGLEWLAHLATSWALFGLIWTVQLVHYPTFRYVPDFSEFHQHHTSSIALIVTPLMVAELAIVCWTTYRTGFSWPWLILLVVVLFIWAVTFLQAIPLHNLLASDRQESTIESLIRVNWPRTVLWTLKAGWISWLFVTRA